MTSTLDEHYSYISQSRRTALFREALAQVVRPGDVVADLGCGFGILGMLALEAGAARCYGIDSSDAIEIARETVRREGLTDRYEVIRGSTFRTSLPEKVDLLLCDHVGYFGFDYGIIGLIEDARARMLKPGGRIVPGAIAMSLCAAEADNARAKADRWGDPAIPAAFRWLTEHEVNTTQKSGIAASELLGAPVRVAAVDFTGELPQSLAIETRLEVSRDGRFDGLAGWFSSTLAPGVELTNSPLDPDAIRRAQLFLPCRESLAVQAGDVIGVRLTIRHDPPLMAWTVTPPNGGKRQAMSTWHSAILSQFDLVRESGRPLTRNAQGEARLALLQLLDGTRGEEELAAALQQSHGQLFPSAEELRRFVRDELRSCGE